MLSTNHELVHISELLTFSQEGMCDTHISQNTKVRSNLLMDAKQIRTLNLKSLIARVGKIAALAETVGTAPAYISQILSEKSKAAVGDDLARRLEVAFALPHGWMDAIHNSDSLAPERGNLSSTARGVTVFDDGDAVDDDVEVEVPSLALKLSAGSGRLQWEIDPSGHKNRYRREWIIRRRLNPKNLVTMKVDGDSMWPGLPDGCSVTLDTSVTNIRSGKRHAIDYMGEFFIKRLFRQPDGSVVVRSDNPDKTRYGDWEIPLAHGDSLRVLGSIIHVQVDTDD